MKWLEYDDDHSHPVLKCGHHFMFTLLWSNTEDYFQQSYLPMSDSVVGGLFRDSLSVISCIMLNGIRNDSMIINDNLIIIESKQA